jgi:hypothetical protein
MNALTPTAKYLFETIEPDLGTRPPLEILARTAPRLRERVRGWWMSLEPEATAGVSVDMMEDALVRIAQHAATDAHHLVSRTWARGLSWKTRMLGLDAERAIADRFLTACERLGVLASQGNSIRFTHDCLLETFLGVALLATRNLPVEVLREPRGSFVPLRTSGGRATLAMLPLAGPEVVDDLFIAVAKENLHIATWFLYFNEVPRQIHGEWLSTELLTAITWDLDGPTQQSLQEALTSLGHSALIAARHFIDERAGSLPAYGPAIDILARYGDSTDVPRLKALRGETALGYWEIERLRQLIRDAETQVFNPAARARYEQAKTAEVAKQTTVFVLKVAAQILTQTAAPHTQWNREMKQWTLGKGVGGAGAVLSSMSPSDFFQQQAALRELLANLPPVIERRKVQISAMAPHIARACDSTIAAWA